jgi:hypothetical protein
MDTRSGIVLLVIESKHRHSECPCRILSALLISGNWRAAFAMFLLVLALSRTSTAVAVGL